MKNSYRIILISLLFFLPVSNSKGQAESKADDKYTLLTMPFNKRPLAMYKSQLQVNAGYNFSIRSKFFDAGGSVQNLKDFGTASVSHYYFLGIKYGITDFLELLAETSYLRCGNRSESETFLSTTPTGGSNQITINRLDESKGFGDLLLQASVRLPLEYKNYDLMVRGGYYLPVSGFEPLEPTIEFTDYTDVNSFTVNYRFNNKNGFGVPVFIISATGKFTANKFAVTAGYTMRDPVKEGKSIRWDEYIEDQSFTFYSSEYNYLLNRITFIEGSFHYQAAGWLDVSLGGSYIHASKGWTEYWGNKYSNPEEKLLTVEPSFEIQVSPLLRIKEYVGIPLSGESIRSPFYIFTTFSFNIFPF
jgi:hypothetical protein